MSKFYDGTEVNMENLKKILQDNDGKDGDMTAEEIATIKAFIKAGYEEDYEYLLEKLQGKNSINWQIIYDIISVGEWNYNAD